MGTHMGSHTPPEDRGAPCAERHSPGAGRGCIRAKREIPVRVTKIKQVELRFDLFYFIQAAGLAWNQCACALHGIAEGVWHHAQACINISLRLDSIPQQVADSIRSLCERFHTRLCRDLVRRRTLMKRNLLLEYSEELAVKIAKLCTEYKIDSNTVFQIKKSSSSVFANITEAQYPQSLADMHSKLEIA